MRSFCESHLAGEGAPAVTSLEVRIAIADAAGSSQRIVLATVLGDQQFLIGMSYLANRRCAAVRRATPSSLDTLPDMKRLIAIALVASAASLGFAHAAAPPVAPAVAPQKTQATTSRGLFEQAVFVGASATAGFGVVAKAEGHSPSIVSVPLAASFAGVVTSKVAVADLGAPFFFLSPGTTGRSLIDRALAKDPTLVVAIDFLFWYVYGADDGQGQRLKSEADRLAKLELGLQQLERFPAALPIVVGDLPDMSLAVGKMLAPSQMPKIETIAKANERIKAWVAKREHTTLFGLASLVTALKSGKPIVAGGLTFETKSDKPNGADKLIQMDDLHPTLRGSIAMALTIVDVINQKVDAGQRATVAKDEAAAKERVSAAAVAILDARAGAGAAPRAPATSK